MYCGAEDGNEGSVVAVMDETLVDHAMSVLEDAARRRRPMTYTAFATAVRGAGSRGAKISALLAELGERSFSTDNALISSLVVGASNGLPNEGFYQVVARLRPNECASDRATLARREQERVYRAYPLNGS